MIKERYCSFEISKLLREKGFDEPCGSTYDIAVSGGKPKFYKYDVLQFFPNGMKNSDDKYGMVISAPTHQMAIDWLREKKNIFIIIEPHAYDYVNEKNKSYSCSLWIGDNYYQYIESRDYPSYGEAVEAILKYVLEKIIK